MTGYHKEPIVSSSWLPIVKRHYTGGNGRWAGWEPGTLGLHACIGSNVRACDVQPHGMRYSAQCERLAVYTGIWEGGFMKDTVRLRQQVCAV